MTIIHLLNSTKRIPGTDMARIYGSLVKKKQPSFKAEKLVGLL